MKRAQFRCWIGGALSLLSMNSPWCCSAVAASSQPEDFASLSLEELAAIKVTSVSKKSEKLAGAPAAVMVITGDDIRRSGALTLPEALRLAPGVEVARVDARQWAVSVRGFNDTFAQKLLVLVDGRSVYAPLFSGTFWQEEDVMIEDIDRIEVIRGPGGTVWGANAVNGVINIVSKPARETQGFLVTGGGGSEHTALGGVRYGGQLGTNSFLRVYGKYDDWADSKLISGGDANDAWWKAQGGFRLDWEPSSNDRFTAQGDLFGLDAATQVPQIALPVFMAAPPATGYQFSKNATWEHNGGNMLGRWTHQFSEESDLSLQTYYARDEFEFPLLTEHRSTYDFDVRHRFQIGERQEIVWGGGYRLTESQIQDSEVVRFSRKERSDQIANAFIQDEIKIVPDRLHWTFGSKIEHNDYTGIECEPGTRLAWTPTDKQTLWASVARAVRTPSQFERDATVNLAVIPGNQFNPFPTVASVVGNSGFESEKLIAYELGYRIQAHPRLSIDAATFVNDYSELRSTRQEVNTTHLPNYLEIDSMFGNQAHGFTYGGELSATWQAADWWRLHAQISLLEADLKQPADAVSGQNDTFGLTGPEYQFSLRSSMDLGRGVELDGWLRYVDSIPTAGVAIPGQPLGGSAIPAYVTFDLRLAWKPIKDLEFALVGQNLGGSHREFNPTFISSQYTEASRRFYGKVTWKF